MCASGARWKEQRMFALHRFSGMGFGKRGTEELVLEELTHLLEELDFLSGSEAIGAAVIGEATRRSDKQVIVHAVNPRLPLARAVTNVISRILFALRLADNAEFREINPLMLEDLVAMNPIAELIPW